MARIVGIRHRTKQTKEAEARPTMVAVVEGDEPVEHKLETEQDELDFLLARFPTSWRNAQEGEDFSKLLAHHIKRTEKQTRVPVAYDGLRVGDVVAMVLGGSGDRFAYALSRRGEELASGTKVLRVPGYVLKDKRGENPKDQDHVLLARLARDMPHLFQEVTPRDREFILLAERLRSRQEAQHARIECEQRLRAYLIGRIFLSPEGRFPEGTVKEQFNRAKASDKIFGALHEEEARREIELRRCVATFDIWEEVFKPVEGCAEVLAAKVMVPVGDIRRFQTPHKLKAYAGVHVLADGRFPRRRSGERANWNPMLRQALYSLGDQFVKRPNSEWGQKLRTYKTRFREKHPAPIVVVSKLTELFRRIERLFLLNDVKIDSSGFNLKTLDGLYEFFEAGRVEIGEKIERGLSVCKEDLFEMLAEEINLLAKSNQNLGNGAQLYTPRHIHKMAIWRTITKFTEWLWSRWTEVESARAAVTKAA